MRPRAALGILALTTACGGRAPVSPPTTPSAPPPANEAAPFAPNAPAMAPAASNAVPTPCGASGARRFTTLRDAFEATLRDNPRVIAVGEAHAQKAKANVPSATRRFGEELLPSLRGKVKDLVLELVVPDKACKKGEDRAAREHTEEATAPQAATNQNEFVTLGFAAKKLGIRPEALVPTCDELGQVVRAGEGDIAAMLSLIADLTARETEAFLAHGDPALGVATYGGLLHNDLSPRPGRETWSFGPRLQALVGGRYVEVDLIVPEFIEPAEPWLSLPWFSSYDATRDGDAAMLYCTGAASYVLVFPRTKDAPHEPGAAG